ncbi:glutamine amidotransferase-related protein [Methylobacterium sp. Leaf85]|uniref:glutamine amidotransferase-related protein n=1 Tax=Methylobacterium sp. Leaf85 TaxID=1736241 RepID=UPI0006F3C0D7|nr:glutamine amidotransferase [Methylobacterium sp. Leaf85]KQO54900.1 glutamine amidotransferase [Methylobacterium sp. Leaf85]
MKIGIIEAGAPPARLAETYPSYGRMVERLLGDPAEVTTFPVAEGRFPTSPEAFDAFVVTGSAAGVYDDLPWIAPLKSFLRDLDGRAKLVGLCFGHQILAAAFGGTVEKSAKGWGIGLHTYDLFERADWMDEATRVSVPAIHQDQVVVPPADARILGGNAFTPYGILSYPQRRAISFQVHPEFETDYATDLIAGHRPALPHDEAFQAAAVASLRGESDAHRVGGWIRRFLQSR